MRSCAGNQRKVRPVSRTLTNLSVDDKVVAKEPMWTQALLVAVRVPFRADLTGGRVSSGRT